MRKKVLICFIFLSCLFIRPAFCAAPAEEYLCELGVTFYRMGRYDEALSEFNRVLMVNPDSKSAKNYINSIFQQEARPLIIPKQSSVRVAQEPDTGIKREEAIDRTFANLAKEEGVTEKPKLENADNAGLSTSKLKISGEVQARLGIGSQDAIWKRANWDLNEKNWRIRSDAAFNRRENTYDPRIYDRLRLNLDTDNKEGFAFHGNIVVDPWSFTGKSSKATVSSNFGDNAELELKYWSNTGYVINETIDTNRLGNSFSLPEIKVYNDKIKAFDIKGAFTSGDVFHIPEMKIYREFQPMRELWVDYKNESLKLSIFPIAYENKAVAFDDPLKLSNNHIWWEDSPWIHSWKSGICNSGATPVDFSKGYWDNAISFFARDSEGRRLTALRGFSFDFSPQEGTSLVTNIAAPKDPWQDYSDVDNFLSATRLKQALTKDLRLGLTATTRLGYDSEDKRKLDAKNYVFGADLGYELIDGLKASLEVAYSQSKYDLTNSQYQTQLRGNAYYVSVFGRFPFRNISEDNYSYDAISPEADEGSFTKFRFFASRMDASFDEPLSSYVETRDDEWWSRHLHFRRPFAQYYQGEGQLLGWEDVKSYRVGNGIDVGRSTLGLRIESLFWDRAVENFLDVRNVHDSDNKFVENVTREELSWKINDSLTTKLLGIYHRLPKTHPGTDPFIFNPRTRYYYDNDQIEDGKDPTVATGSLGMEYKFFEWLALNGIWEYTNDISLNYDNFPRGILEDAERSRMFYENDNKYRAVRNWLTSQQYFPKPPYPYYNIFKAGLRFNPMEKCEIYLDYARNPYEKAGQVDDNMNHVGFQIGYLPSAKLSLFLKYTYSRWQDLDSISQGITKLSGHHNVFTELVYRRSENEDLTFQYGEASRDPYMGGVLDIGWDPYGGSLRTIDTQQIFRLYYRRKF